MNSSRSRRRSWRALPWLVALLLLGSAVAAFAQQREVDPPGRVANLTQRHGSIVFAPDGEQEWLELPQNRPLTDGHGRGRGQGQGQGQGQGGWQE